VEKMPYRDPEADAARPDGAAPRVGAADWRNGLPTLAGREVTLRELRSSDAASLLTLLSTEEVTRFMAPPPATIGAWERFILWTHWQRAEGSYLCFGVVPDGHQDAIGLFQVRQLEPGFGTADWDFALGFPFWGSGLFVEAATLVAGFLFDVVGTHRLEARSAVGNHRGNGALKKIGATQEGILRKSLLHRGQYVDQVLWTIVNDDWRTARTGRSSGLSTAARGGLGKVEGRVH
jgi:[ribosomal protein S5]-alanine N-acetyltransferase